jgi:hypothetical protein
VPAAGTDSHAGMHHQQNHPAQSHGEQNEPCQTPASQECCRALTSCSPTIVVTQATIVADLVSAQVNRPSSPETSKLSRVSVPEPPPPKA